MTWSSTCDFSQDSQANSAKGNRAQFVEILFRHGYKISRRLRYKSPGARDKHLKRSQVDVHEKGCYGQPSSSRTNKMPPESVQVPPESDCGDCSECSDSSDWPNHQVIDENPLVLQCSVAKTRVLFGLTGIAMWTTCKR